MDPFDGRRARLAQSFISEGLDAVLISNPVNVSYLTGFSGDSSFLVVSRERSILVSDPRFTEQIAEECPELDTKIRPFAKKTLDAVVEVLTSLGSRTVGLESGHLTLAEMEKLEGALPAVSWKKNSDRVENMRMIKDDTEITQVREAIAIGERAFTVLCALLRPEQTEKELGDAIDHYIRQAGGYGCCFPPIMAVGPRSALPHAPPSQHAVRDGEMLLVDWGVSGRFYKSDLTRVLDTRKSASFTGNGKHRLEDIHAIVCRAQQDALNAVRPGVKASDVDAVARATIEGAGYGDYFNHGLGHGIGMQVHELPAVRPYSETILQAGMVFTIEPGIYLPGWGGVRIEDDVLVTPDGCEVLSRVSRAL